VSEINNELKEQANKLQFFGIYYDDPTKIKNVEESRAILGIIFNQKGASQINFNVNDFIQRNNEYKTAEMPKLNAFGAVFPMFNKISIILHTFRGYPTIKKYGIKKNLLVQTKFTMELYNFTEKKFSIYFPYGSSTESLVNLSCLTKPSEKEYVK
jgi:hypothetical protein